MNVMVLGGNGLFGRKTVINLVKDPEIKNVVSMDVTPVKSWVLRSMEGYEDKFTFIRGDVSELEDILSVIKTYSIDKLVNWAFLLPGVAESNPRPSVKVNALGMCNVFEAARLMDIKRVIYASSEGVYGPQNEYGARDVNEDDNPHPGNGYALMKRFAEILADQYHSLYGINFTALRPAVGYGHGGLTPFTTKEFSDICSLPAVGKPFKIDRDGTQPWSPTAADDVAEMTRILLHMDSSPHPAYNIGGPPTTLLNMAQIVRRFIPDAVIEFGTEQLPVDWGQFGIPWRLSMDRAKEDLGFSVYSNEEAVRMTINDARIRKQYGGRY